MFKYGKKAGYMGIALLVLAVIPLVVAACVIPNIGPEVATKFNAAGVFFNVINVYFMYSAITGMGFGLGF